MGVLTIPFIFLTFVLVQFGIAVWYFKGEFVPKYPFVGKDQSQGCAGTDAGTGSANMSDALIFQF